MTPDKKPADADTGKVSRWIPSLTWRSGSASLLLMLGLACIIQKSTVAMGMESSSEFGLPIPGMILISALIGVGGLFAVFFRFKLLSRAELVCIFYTMVLAAPLMTQGFWHRMLSITSSIPRAGDFKKMEFLSDKLWLHGPNLLVDQFQKPFVLKSSPSSGEVCQSMRISVSTEGKGIVPGAPYMIFFQAKAEKLDSGSFYFVRVRQPGSDAVQEILRSSEPAVVDKLNPEGFVPVGLYGFQFLSLDSATEVDLEFGLSGSGQVEIKNPKLFNVSALETIFTGVQTVSAAEYAKLTPSERAGVIPRPENLFSMAGVVFLLKSGIPFLEWTELLVVWGSLIAFILVGALAINVLMRRAWVDGERLPLPLARIPQALVGNPEEEGPFARIWSMRVFWVGAILALIWGLLRGLHFYNPNIPDANIKIDLAPYFGASMGDFWKEQQFQVLAVVVAVSVFVELNVLASLVVGYFAYRSLFWLGSFTGWSAQVGYPHAHYQQLGALVAYGFLIVILARKHIWSTLREAYRPSLRPEGNGELFSYRSAYLMLAFVVGGAVLWAQKVDISSNGMLVFMGLMLLFALVSSKFRAESGMPSGYFMPQNGALALVVLGGIPMFGAEAVLLTFICSFIFCVSVFFLIPGAQLELIELGRTYRIKRSHIVGVLILGLLGGLIIGGWVFLGNAYANGAETMKYSWAFIEKPWYFRDFNSQLVAAKAGIESQASFFNPSNMAFTLAAGVTAVLTLLRQVFAGFWLHPMGFIVGSSAMSQLLWGSFLVAWFLRFVFVKFGGGLAVRNKLQPFFIGVLLGSALSWLIWFAYNTHLSAQGVMLIYKEIP